MMMMMMMMMMMILIIMIMLTIVSSFKTSSNINSNIKSNTRRRSIHLFDASTSSTSSSSGIVESLDSSTSRRNQLKSKLYRLCAVCDRGFGAMPSDRVDIMACVQELKEFSTIDATYGLYPRNDDRDESKELLMGAWQMIYTNAIDVLSLAASPVTTINGIYQTIDSNGDSANIIDLSPRVEALLPPSLRKNGSLIRLKVITKAFTKSPTRVGLNFKSFQIVPKSFFAIPISLPFDIGASLPQSLLFRDNADGTSSSPGFFDIEYLDEDLLIIKQNAVAGYFISIRSAKQQF